MTWFVNVNRNIINSNTKNGTDIPPISIRKGKHGVAKYCSGVVLPAASRIRYSPDSALLGCGARVIIECDEEPTIE
jgi:hypothetical protein